MTPKRFVIPRAFNWLLPAQGVVAAVAIYSSIYVFGVGTTPMILAVVAAGIHFVLGLSLCLTQSLPNQSHYHKTTIPIFLLLGAGVWAACLYYLAKQVDLLLTYPSLAQSYEQTSQPQTPLWSKVGLAATALNVFLDLALLVIIILSILDQKPTPLPTISAPQQQQSYYTSHHQFTTPTPLSHNHHTPIPPVPPIPSTYYSPSSPPRPPTPPNRITLLRRLCALQHPATGSWVYSPELAQLLNTCGISLSPPTPQEYETTTLTHASLSNLLHQIYTAAIQQQQQQHHQNLPPSSPSLTQSELLSLQELNHNLDWANLALQRAANWLDATRGAGVGVGVGVDNTRTKQAR
ncbi:hypothetical protein QBC41DRAFT_349246 [Cercophora samala]|uniref:Uncharacterized protein n=1 Tax=Cercophora samala TaxID=330535 RepID=A0AA39Z817_9PEZI|nr:hypothetical protein QBC41DRAFT_349246 [Cercophora samala]